MKRCFVILVLALVALSMPAPLWAQQPAEPPAEKPAEEKPASEEPADEKPAVEQPADEKPAEPATPSEPVTDSAEDPAQNPTESEESPEATVEGEAAEEPEAPEEVEEVEESEGFGDSPISDLANDSFEPLEDIEESQLAQIIPAAVYPRVEWDGQFRVRVGGFVNYDLDTGGTSAVLPPLESYVPSADDDRNDTSVPREDADGLWGMNMRLRLEPSIHISEMLMVHAEVDFLDNIVLGSIPSARDGSDGITPELSDVIANSNQRSPQGRFWYEDAVKINEAYGVVRTIFGELWLGRMDDHWGMGMWMNDGDCKDCNYGNNADRLFLRSGIFGLYGTAAIDLPDEGLTSKSPSRLGGQPYDLSQVDEADQFTFSILRNPVTREDLEIQQKKLIDDKSWVPNGGLLYRYRNHQGYFDGPVLLNEVVDPASPPLLVYQGLRLHVFDLWTQLLYQPSHDTSVRIEIEGLVAFGSIDNDTGTTVGDETVDDDAVNCFDEDVRLAEEDRCLENKRDAFQWGAAMESEIRLGGPISFGVNAGFASGGDTPNYGLGGTRPDYDFFRFNPDYHVDLILFRNVIGTVTNAAYYNPYISARLLESSGSHVQLDLDGILSHALDKGGTPSGESAMLGLEFDAAAKYVILDNFEAGLEGGILFPFGGLDAVENRPRFSNPGESGAFGEDADAGIAWTLQFKFFWSF